MKLLANLQGYRTLILNGLILGAAVLGRDKLPISPEEVDVVLLGLATLGNMMLRVYTTTPIGTKATG